MGEAPRRSKSGEGGLGGAGKKKPAATSLPSWFWKVTGTSVGPEEKAEMEKRRRAALKRQQRSQRSLAEGGRRLRRKEASKSAEDEAENFPFTADGEARSVRSLATAAVNPFTAKKLMESAPMGGGAAEKRRSVGLDWDPWATPDVLLAHDTEFQTEVVKLNTAMNLAMVQKAESDEAPGELGHVKTPRRLARLTEIFRRKRVIRVKIQAAPTRTDFHLDASGRIVKEHTSIDRAPAPSAQPVPAFPPAKPLT